MKVVKSIFILLIVFLMQSSLFADIKKIPFLKEAQTYENFSYNDVEFFTYNTSSITNKYIGFIVDGFNISEYNNGHDISFDIHNYSNLIGSLDVYNSKGELVFSQAIDNHQIATDMINATLEFYKDTVKLFYAIKYNSLNVARNPYKKTSISFSLPNKNYIIKLSLSSDRAIAYNAYKVFLNIGKEVVGAKIKLNEKNKFIAEFMKNIALGNIQNTIFTQLKNTSDEAKDEIIKSILLGLFETTLSNSKTHWDVIKKGMDFALLTADTLTVIKNAFTYWERDKDNKLGTTIYINLLASKNNRGFFGNNNAAHIQSVFNKTKVDFPDVSLDSEYFPAIKYLYNINTIRGYGDGKFYPYQKVSRAQILKMILATRKELIEGCLYNNGKLDYSESSELITYNKYYTDVTDDDWFSPYVWCANDQNIATGYSDRSFKPNNPVNLAEAFKFVAKGLNDENQTYSEKIGTDWWSVYEGIFLDKNHVDNLIKEAASIELNRGQTAQLIYSMCEGNSQCKQ